MAGSRKGKARFNTKRAQPALGGGFRLRIWHTPRRPAKGRRRGRSASFRIKCGCCDESVLIVYDNQTIEVNGVIAPLAEWRLLLDPLLDGKEPVAAGS